MEPSPVHSSPLTDTSAATTPTPITVTTMMAGGTSPVLSPTNGLKKPKNLRVQIPMEGKENTTLTDTMIKTEESSELPPVSLLSPYRLHMNN